VPEYPDSADGRVMMIESGIGCLVPLVRDREKTEEAVNRAKEYVLLRST